MSKCRKCKAIDYMVPVRNVPGGASHRCLACGRYEYPRKVMMMRKHAKRNAVAKPRPRRQRRKRVEVEYVEAAPRLRGEMSDKEMLAQKQAEREERNARK